MKCDNLIGKPPTPCDGKIRCNIELWMEEEIYGNNKHPSLDITYRCSNCRDQKYHLGAIGGISELEYLVDDWLDSQP